MGTAFMKEWVVVDVARPELFTHRLVLHGNAVDSWVWECVGIQPLSTASLETRS